MVKRHLNKKWTKKKPLTSFTLGENGGKRARVTRYADLGSSTDVIIDLESKDDKISNLQAEVEQLQRQLANKDIIIDKMQNKIKKANKAAELFKLSSKPTRRNGSGKATTYSSMLTGVTVESLSEGVAATDIRTVLSNVALHCDLIDDDLSRLPNIDWFRKQRTEMVELAQRQMIDFVSQSSYIVLSFDETSIHQEKTASFGCTNDLGEFLCLVYFKSLANTGVALAEEMWVEINKLTIKDDQGVSLSTLIRRKTVGLVTDRSRLQENGNKHFLRKLNSHPDRTNMEEAIPIICLMHLVSNCEKYFHEEQSASCKSLHSCLRRIFGGTGRDKFNKHSLRAPLKYLTKIAGLFETGYGKR